MKLKQLVCLNKYGDLEVWSQIKTKDKKDWWKIEASWISVNSKFRITGGPYTFIYTEILGDL